MNLYVVILMVLCTSVLQTDARFYLQHLSPLQKALESALTTKDNMYAMRQAFLPIFHTYGQESQLVYINVSVQITIDPVMNSTSCTASDTSLNADVNSSLPSSCWLFLWTDSALLSLITIDQLLAFDQVYVILLYSAAVGGKYARATNISLPIICPVMPTPLDIKTSLIPLLSWSKSYVRYQGAPSQWEESDKGYIQESYDQHWLAESPYTYHNHIEDFAVHAIRLVMIVTFTLLNILVLIAVVSYGKQCHTTLHQITFRSTRITAVMWASMITVLLVNILYFSITLNAFIPFETPLPRVWACMTSNASWCASMKSTKLYSDEVVSLLVKLTVVPFTIIMELITAVRLTRYALLPLPWAQVTRPRYFLRVGRRVTQIILIWNVMVFIQIVFGVALLSLGVFMVIAPGATISLVSTLLFIAIEFIVFLSYFILRHCSLISLKQCCSLSLFIHVFITILIFSLSTSIITLYYAAIGLGVKPWSVKGSILSLLPSFLVTPLLWFTKKYFFKKDRVTEEEQNGISMAVHSQSAAHLENSNEEEGEEEEESEEEDDINEERRLLHTV